MDLNTLQRWCIVNMLHIHFSDMKCLRQNSNVTLQMWGRFTHVMPFPQFRSWHGVIVNGRHLHIVLCYWETILSDNHRGLSWKIVDMIPIFNPIYYLSPSHKQTVANGCCHLNRLTDEILCPRITLWRRVISVGRCR
jgi:hypothetical protein